MAKDDKSTFLSDQLGVSADQTRLDKIIDTHRWLMNNGFLNDIVKDQLMLFGAIVHTKILNVELTVDPDIKKISYVLYVSKSLLKKHKKYLQLRGQDGIWALWRFKRLYKKERNLDFAMLIERFIKDYLGPKWTSSVEVKDTAEYKEGYEYEEEKTEESPAADQRPDSG